MQYSGCKGQRAVPGGILVFRVLVQVCPRHGSGLKIWEEDHSFIFLWKIFKIPRPMNIVKLCGVVSCLVTFPLKACPEPAIEAQHVGVFPTKR